MKDNSTEFVKIRYYSACRGDTVQETSRCEKLKIGQQVNFTAKVEVGYRSKTGQRLQQGGLLILATRKLEQMI